MIQILFIVLQLLLCKTCAITFKTVNLCIVDADDTDRNLSENSENYGMTSGNLNSDEGNNLLLHKSISYEEAEINQAIEYIKKLFLSSLGVYKFILRQCSDGELRSPSVASIKNIDVQSSNVWKIESLIKDSDSGSEEEFYDCQGLKNYMCYFEFYKFML